MQAVTADSIILERPSVAAPAICTIIAKNYLAHARVLTASFLEHHPAGRCYVLVIDEHTGYFDATAERFTLVTAWRSVHLGLCAGLAPELRMDHLIAKNKANLRYMTRLAFGVMASWEPALIEAFPEELECLRKRIPTVLRIIAQLLFLVLTDLVGFRLRKSFIVSSRFIVEQVYVQYYPMPNPRLMARAVRKLSRALRPPSSDRENPFSHDPLLSEWSRADLNAD